MPIDPKSVKWDDTPSPSAIQWDDQSVKSESGGFNPMDVIAPIVAPLEVGAQMATGLGAKALSGLAGIASGGDADVVRRVQSMMTYEPQMDLSKGLSKAISYPFEKLSEASKSAGGAIGERIAGEQGRIAGESIGEVLPDVAGTLAGGYGALKGAKASAAKQVQSMTEKSAQDAARIDAAKLAVEKYGISLDPITSNPTLANKLRVTAAGQEQLNALLRKQNEPKISKILKEDVGIPANEALTSVDVFNKVRAEAAIPKNTIKTMSGFVDDGVTSEAVNSLRIDQMIGGKAAAKKVNSLVDEANAFISGEVSGAKLIDNIENLRKNARDIYKGKEIKPTQRALADTYMGIANALEGMIERNLQTMGKTDLLAEYKVGRTQMAKAYTLQEATNLNTGLVDPSYIAKLTSKDNALTGAFADIGKIAGNFPDAVNLKPGAPGGLKEIAQAQTHITRTGPAGTVGYMIGSMFGQPLIGAALGAGAGELGGLMYGRRLATNPAVQRAVSVPVDYRPMLTPLQATQIQQQRGMLSGEKP